MSEPNNRADGKPTGAVIRRVRGAEESAHDRLLKKHAPAWVLSGAFHVAILVAAILVGTGGRPNAAATEDIVQAVVDEREEDAEQKLDLTNPDLGLQSDLAAAVEVNRVEDRNVETPVVPDEPVGVAAAELTTPTDVPALAGIGNNMADLGVLGTDGNVIRGTGGMGGNVVGKAFQGRSGATKDELLKAGGGNAATERAVALGLVWLAAQQKKNGSWAFDGVSSNDTIAATGMALLPFLAAGQTHKPAKESKYRDVVENAAKYLIANQIPASGTFKGSSGMYSHALATIALCELYGMTGDKQALLLPTRKAVEYVMAAQGADGSWGYKARQEGDTSIVGWQIQALQSAKMCKDIPVDDRVIAKARRFLDRVASGAKKSQYGYRTNNDPTPTRSAVGLLCRYYLDGWTAIHPGMADGVQKLLRQPPTDKNFNMYYYYYATQVVHFHDGSVWHDEWNPKMRDLLLVKQVTGKGKDLDGSWEPNPVKSDLTASHCGRLGTTCLALLTLEVYYRHLPLYKRDTGGLKELERTK